jgi:hypothetical protein
MTDEEQREAATALWQNADRDSRTVVELSLAKEMKFRPHSVGRLSADRVVGRLLRIAEELPDNVLFQFLFHLHMAHRRALLTQFLDAVGLPHEDGVLDLSDDTKPPDQDTVEQAANTLIADHGRQALVYLATLKVADGDFWSGVDPVLERYREDGETTADNTTS